MHYPCLAEPIANDDGYSLVSFREVDALLIARWRNEQMRVLRQSRALTDESQMRYFREIIVPSMSVARPEMILASVLLRGHCIGYGGLTRIDWSAGRAEVSFLAETSRTMDHFRYATDFASFLDLLKIMAFSRLRLRRLFTETYDIRPYHVAALENVGFKLEGRLRKHYLIDGTLTDGLLHGLLSEEYGV
jgi:RimJ/RimL family protein N-acetyltransferase